VPARRALLAVIQNGRDEPVASYDVEKILHEAINAGMPRGGFAAKLGDEPLFEIETESAKRAFFRLSIIFAEGHF
jgi:hypothetical protein